MDIAVQTGVTKTTSGTSVLSLSLRSKGAEEVLLLLQAQAEERAARTLEEECETVVRHALLETEGEVWSRLDGALKEMNGLLKGLLLSQAVEDVHAIVAVAEKDGMLHVSHAGRGEAYLVRGGTASQITEYSRGKPLSAFVHISSGPLEPGDAVVFSTQRLLRSFTPAQLMQMAQRGDRMLPEVVGHLDGERETAAVAVLGAGGQAMAETPAVRSSLALPSRRSGKRMPATGRFASYGALIGRTLRSFTPFLLSAARGARRSLPSSAGFMQTVRARTEQFLADLRHPQRKRRAHLLLLAGAVAAFLIIFLVVKLTVTSQRSKTRTELGILVEQINQEIKTSENRRLAGDVDAANDILQRADAWAKQVMDNESGLFRLEAMDLLDRIRTKREEINNIVRLSPRVLVNLSSKNPSVNALGLVGVADGEFIAYDRQSWYHVLLNGVDDPKPLADDGSIIDGAPFPRYKSQAFLTTGNALIELQGSQPVPMKTEDPAGWATGKDLETYLRYLYILSTDNRIYKYERLSNRYGTAVQYNVNGDLSGALDMAIDASVYVLKEGGTVVKLFRGENKPFVIRHLPPDALKTAVKFVKAADSNFYFLDPAKSRVIVLADGSPADEASYLRQYVLEGEQIGKLQDLYVDPDESHLYVADEKRVYVIDIVK
ncbi:MAG: hypothetical protein PHW10_01945 [Candidatus Peribacteraceae bacterium]|nr:hypothetical protein [Candidatus Peribacteraceae bacterium]